MSIDPHADLITEQGGTVWLSREDCGQLVIGPTSFTTMIAQHTEINTLWNYTLTANKLHSVIE